MIDIDKIKIAKIFKDYPFIIKYINEEHPEWLYQFIKTARDEQHLLEYAEIINCLAIIKWSYKYNEMSRKEDFYD